MGNLRLCRRTREVRQFREASESLCRTACRFPSPRPSPAGRGNSRRQVRLFGKCVGQTPRWVVLKTRGGFSLSPGERAGVRGKGTLAVPIALALPRKSADRPKGRMALSHSFFRHLTFVIRISAPL